MPHCDYFFLLEKKTISVFFDFIIRKYISWLIFLWSNKPASQSEFANVLFFVCVINLQIIIQARIPLFMIYVYVMHYIVNNVIVIHYIAILTWLVTYQVRVWLPLNRKSSVEANNNNIFKYIEDF